MPIAKDVRALVAWPIYMLAMIFWIPATGLTWLAGVIGGEIRAKRSARILYYISSFAGLAAFCLVEIPHYRDVVTAGLLAHPIYAKPYDP